MSIWLRAVIVSTALAFGLVMYQSVFHIQSVGYEPGVSAAELEKLKYFDAVKLLESRAKAPVFGFSVFLDEAQDWWFWQQVLIAWSNIAGLCFVTCAVLILWARRVRQPKYFLSRGAGERLRSSESPVSADAQINP